VIFEVITSAVTNLDSAGILRQNYIETETEKKFCWTEMVAGDWKLCASETCQFCDSYFV